MSVRGFLWLGFALLLVGCKSVGPDTIGADRFDYGLAVSDSWKRATLYNLVKLRYADTPHFVEVGQIVAGYTVETGSTLNAQVGTGLPNGATANVGVGGSIRYTDRPTITYVPMTGGRFLKGMMTPLSLESIFFLVESGIPADAVLLLGGASLSGLRNPSPEYYRALELLRQLRAAGALDMRVEKDAVLLTLPVSYDAATLELRQLLHLDPQATELTLSYSRSAAGPRDVALRTRTLMQILQAMAAQIEVPQQDIDEGRAAPGVSDAHPSVPAELRLMRIKCSREQPTEALVSIHYRGRYFWLDDRDFRSKQYFGYLMLLFTLIDSSKEQPLPVLTIPTQ